MSDASSRIIDELRQENQALRERVRALEEVCRQLQERVGEAERAGKRQAAPFRRREAGKVPEAEKKRPGRKPGHQGHHRAVPAVVDESVEVPLDGCPGCGGAVDQVERVEQLIEDIPPTRPRVTRLVTYVGHCPGCGEVRSRHPIQVSYATGAARVHLGARALALAAALNKGHGLTMRATCRVLAELAGLRLTPGGLAQALGRVAGRLEPAYDHLIAEVRDAAAVFADETSWYVGGPKHWLWTFTTDTATAYRVEPSRCREVVTDTLGPDFAGVLVSDCLSIYDDLPYRRHKCIAHHLRAIAEARERADTADPTYLKNWALFFESVIGHWRARSRMTAEAFEPLRVALESWRDRLLAEEPAQPGDAAIRHRLEKQKDHLLTCLRDPAAEPTNNRAERALRPAVIARKLSCGNKTEAGARAFEILASLVTTCRQRSEDAITYLAACLPLSATVAPIPAPSR
jgi:transposase